MPFETARARVALARNLRAAGREADADGELRRHGRCSPRSVDHRPGHDGLAAVSRRRRPDRELTARELEILRNVAEGLSDNEIAKRLYLSPHTDHRHVANIRTKLRQPSGPPPRPTRLAKADLVRLAPCTWAWPEPAIR